MYPNRTLCQVLEEMRTCCETLNFSYLKGLIEEIQVMGNRMESALYDKKDIKDMLIDKEELEKEIDQLREEIEKLKNKRNKLNKEGEKDEN